MNSIHWARFNYSVALAYGKIPASTIGIMMVLFERTRVAIAVLVAYQLVFEGSIRKQDVAEGCANGFIQLDMLRTVAQKIPNGAASPNRLSDELRLIPDWNFTCNGTITSILLGADIRTTTAIRKQYPEVQIWRRTDPSSTIREYAIVWYEEIRLNAGYFSPSGVLEYRLINPFNFQAGDIFGVYQPDDSSSVVRIYYNDNDKTAPVFYTFTGSSIDVNVSYNIDSTDFSLMIQQQLILISPVAGIAKTVLCDIPTLLSLINACLHHE